ncbi:MAG: CarD family transcriptional regulator [Lachnospiraceae bacterium]|nr:CarD family transcriptional regulator [Lachnospiraceae bacterium]
MFEVGDYVIYGTNGVCRIEAVGKIDSSIMDNKRIYYTLVPFYSKSGRIYVPTDSDKVAIRKILSKEEAIAFIDGIGDIETLWITDEKTRELTYKEAFRTHDCHEYVRIIKTIYFRKEERIAEKKKLTATDERYFRMAEEQLYGELGVSLSMDKDKVRDYIYERMEA